MADLSAVMEALKALLVGAIYPTLPAVAGGSAVGFDALFGIGWPDDEELRTTLRAGQAFVGVFPLDGERNTTIWDYAEQEVPRSPPGIQAGFDPAALAAVFTGTARAGDVVGVAYDGTAYTFALSDGQTPDEVAALIAAGLPPGKTVTIPGGVVGFDYARDLSVRFGNNGLTMRNVGSIERRLQATIWSYDQQSRDTLFSALITIVQDTQFLLVPAADGAASEAARLSYNSSSWSDKPQNAGGYMRALIVTVDFQTTIYKTAYEILFAGTTLNNVHYGPA